MEHTSYKHPASIHSCCHDFSCLSVSFNFCKNFQGPKPQHLCHHVNFLIFWVLLLSFRLVLLTWRSWWMWSTLKTEMCPVNVKYCFVVATYRIIWSLPNLFSSHLIELRVQWGKSSREYLFQGGFSSLIMLLGKLVFYNNRKNTIKKTTTTNAASQRLEI